MPVTPALVNIVAQPLPPAPQRRAPSLTYAQRVEIAAARKQKQQTIEAAISEWFEDCKAVANDLSDRFGYSPEHILNRMFSGALKLHSGQRKPNGYNAYLHHVAAEDGGKSVVELAETHRETYAQLSSEEKQRFVHELSLHRTSQQQGLRVDQRSRTQDVNFVLKEIENMLTGLRARTGVDAFFCVVRNCTEFQLRPRWFFTDPAIEEFLDGSVRGFDVHKIAGLVEVFAISGADYFNQLRNATEKVNYLKAGIRDMLSAGLIAITGDPYAQMSYAHFTRDIQIGYGVTLVGWTHSKWGNPSELGSSIPPLKTLYDALKSGSCKFVSLSSPQLDAIKLEYVNGGDDKGDDDDDDDSGAGGVADSRPTKPTSRKKRSDAGKPRKKRSDAGKPRKKAATAAPVDEDVDNGAGPSKRRRVDDATTPATNT